MSEKEFHLEKIKDVADILMVPPATVTLGAKAFEAIEAVIETPGTRTVYVVDEGERLKGSISFRALLMVTTARYSVHKGGIASFFKHIHNVLADNITDFMEECISVTNETLVLDAMKAMEKYKLNDVPVVDAEGRLVGVFSGTQLLRAALEHVRKGDLGQKLS